MAAAPLITCLWFATEAEEAANYYVSIFRPDAAITSVRHHTAAGHATHQRPAGSVLLVEFTLRGQKFVALNGGTPQDTWSFTPRVSFQIDCADQAEVDRFWAALGDGEEGGEGSKVPRRCGWLGDKYGVSWQVVPTALKTFLAAEDREAADRAMTAMMGMEKLDIAALQKAFDGV